MIMKFLFVLLIMTVTWGAHLVAEDLTLPPVNVSLDYTPFNVSGFTATFEITLPGGSNAWVETLPSSALLYQVTTGNPIGTSEQVLDPQGRVNFVTYDNIDTVTSFIFADSAPGFSGRRYGLCSIRLNSNAITGDPGALDVYLTDLATGAKLTGATVALASPTSALIEVGDGQYRAQTTTTQARTINASLTGYNSKNFPATLTAGMITSLPQTLTNPTPGVVNISTTASNPTGANPIPFRIYFFKPVNAALGDFTISDLAVTNGVISSLDGGPGDYTAQVIPTAAGVVQLALAAGTVRDNANIPNAAANTLAITYDATGPEVTIDQALTQVDPATSYPLRFAVHFSESVTGFTSGDVRLSGTAGDPKFASVTGSGADYVVEVVGMSGPGTVIATIGADAATGASGPSRASSSTDNVVTWSPPANYSLPTLIRRLDYTATSTPPSEFTNIDLGANAWVVLPPRNSNTRLTQFSGAAVPIQNEIAITTQDTVVTSAATGKVRVGANGLSGDTSDFFTYSLTPPGTADRQFGFVHLTMVNNSDLNLTIGGVFVTLRDGAGNRITGATLAYGATAETGAPFSEVTAGVYRLIISNNTTGTIFVRAAGFQDVAQVRALSVGFFPEVPIVLTVGSLVATITSPIAELTRAKSFPVTFTFSTSVSDFTAADIVMTNGSFSGLAPTDASGTTYTGTVTARSSGRVRIEIASGAANAGGFASNAAALTRTYDPTGPLVTINQASGQSDPSVTGPFAFTVVFTAPVSGFTASDVSFSSSTSTGALTAVVTGSGTTYSVSVSGMVGDGTVIASIPVDAALANGHPSAASTSTDNSVTFTPPSVGRPSVTINQDANQPDPTPLPVIAFRVRFSNPVNGFTASDVTLSGTASGPLSRSITKVGISEREYLVLVSGMSSAGTVIASIAAGAAIGQAGSEPILASTSTDNEVTYAPVNGAISRPTAAEGSSACGLGSGLATLLLGSALLLISRRTLR